MREDGARETPRLADLSPARLPRGALRLTLDPVVGSLFFAKTLSATGVWMHNVVAAVLIFEVTGSASMVGLTAALQSSRS